MHSLDSHIVIIIVKIILLHYGLDFGGISQCAMLFRSNFFLVTAGGQYPKFSRNIVFLYECVSKKFVLELNFSSPVKSIRLSKSKSVIQLQYYK